MVGIVARYGHLRYDVVTPPKKAQDWRRAWVCQCGAWGRISLVGFLWEEEEAAEAAWRRHAQRYPVLVF